jgi:hypothetical protein
MPRKYLILIADEDAHMRDILADQLTLREDFSLHLVDTALKGFNMIRSDPPDLLILNMNAHDVDGTDFIRTIRREGFRFPIIVLTEHAEWQMEVMWLELGANDLIRHPFCFAVLLARIRVQLRQFDTCHEVVYKIGLLTIHPAKKKAIKTDGDEHQLTDKELKILRYLRLANEKVISREVLLTRLWGTASSSKSHALESHIYRLRQKIEPDPQKPRYLITARCGYKLRHL